MIRCVHDGSWEEPKIVIEVITDPEQIARSKAMDEQFKRNLDWLQSHWGDVLPQARGKFVAVAGQQTFVADTAKEAWAWCDNTHPEDKGPWVTFVPATLGPRIYANRG